MTILFPDIPGRDAMKGTGIDVNEFRTGIGIVATAGTDIETGRGIGTRIVLGTVATDNALINSRIMCVEI